MQRAQRHRSPEKGERENINAYQHADEVSQAASSPQAFPDTAPSPRLQVKQYEPTSGGIHEDKRDGHISRDAAHEAPLTPGKTQSAPRPQLLSSATTAISRTDIHTQSYQDGTRETFAISSETPSPEKSLSASLGFKRYKGLSGSEGGDTASIRSYAPASETGGDTESLIGDVFGTGESNQIWKIFGNVLDGTDGPNEFFRDEDEVGADFYREFDDVSITQTGQDEQELLSLWRGKRKHFLILSTAGKPIYSRHGDDNLIPSTMGTIQTIISFFEGSQNQLKGFTSSDTRFVIMSQGPLYLVAISKLVESDAQLRAQLEALYMQILSTLTLPTLTTLFTNRPSTDLRRPLKGTEVLLSSLADAFTRGSPSALLSALECLKMRKSHRKAIDNALLRTRSSDLLYGLVVANGKLVSVVRPRKHSLHAGDLQLILNMLFEAEGIKAAGGENWIPLCLPGFNKNGYLYMYVSFVPLSGEFSGSHQSPDASEQGLSDEVAILLISSNKESFYDLRKMRDDFVGELEKNGSLPLIKDAIRCERLSTTDIVPGTVLHHFLYKSRSHVQYVMSSYEPHYTNMLARRRLLSIYHRLQASVHAKNSHLNVQHCVSPKDISLAWVTPLFEFYCVAGAHASKGALAQNANKVVQWVRREEQRVFIIGGAVF